MKQTVLLTGFRPFLTQTVNPSQIIVEKLAADSPSSLAALVLPVEFGRASELLAAHLQKNSEIKHVVMLGQAGGRRSACLEKVALNWQETDFPDEGGVRPPTGPLLQSAPTAYVNSQVDLGLVKVLQKNGPVELSFSAGTFVCNDLYFRTWHQFGQRLNLLFIHLPFLPEQTSAAGPNLSLERGLAIVTHYLHLSQTGEK